MWKRSLVFWMGTVEKSLREKLLASFSPTRLEIFNESHRHSRGSETHFNVIIVADKFRGLSRVKQHQLVYSALGELMSSVHALTLTCYSE